MELMDLSMRLRALTVFRGLLSEPVIEALCSYLDCMENAWPQGVVSGYAELVSRLYRTDEGDLGRHIQRVVMEHENVYIRAVGRGETPPDYVTRSVAMELETLQEAASLTPDRLRAGLDGAGCLPDFGTTAVDLTESYFRRTAEIERCGYGVYAGRHMFCLDGEGRIVPAGHPDPVRLEDLVGYERERGLVLDNVRALLEGRKAANMLLTGDAGTGKSSTVKAVGNAWKDEGLRIVEVRREQLGKIPALLDELSENPLKFILFIDDLSFRGDDDGCGALKAVLEGSVSARSGNVIICATSNRRHIVKEKFSDREGDDVHRGDAMQETVSLSDRFGLHITFQRPGKDDYLTIVHTLARRQGVDGPELDALAERFALLRGGRSPRLARQFVDSLEARGGGGRGGAARQDQ